MTTRRVHRLNSLLKEVVSDVIRQELSNPKISPLLTITRVEITSDLHYAKVYFSVIGDDKTKKETLEALSAASGFIGFTSSKQVVMRHFPELTFLIDEGVDNQMKIDKILHDIEEEKHTRADTAE